MMRFRQSRLFSQVRAYGLGWAFCKFAGHYRKLFRQRMEERRLPELDEVRLSSALEPAAGALTLVISSRTSGGSEAYLDKALRESRGSVVVLCAMWHGVRLTVHRDGEEVLRARVPLAAVYGRGVGLPRCQRIVVNHLSLWNHGRIVNAVLEWKRTWNARVTLLVHDYLLFCPLAHLLNGADRFCNPEVEGFHCEACGFTEKASREWRRHSTRLLAAGDEIRCFSEDTARRMRLLVPETAARITVVPHQPLSDLPRVSVVKEGPLTIGVFGSLTRARGSEFVRDLSDYLARENPDARIVIMGPVEHPYRAKNITLNGSYRREELPGLVARHGIRVGLVASIVPETFSYVTQELMMLGLPLACFDLGAQRDHLSRYPHGMIIPEMTVRSAYETIAALVKK